MIEVRKLERSCKELQVAGQLIRESMPDRHTSGCLVSIIIKYFLTWPISIGEDGPLYDNCG